MYQTERRNAQDMRSVLERMQDRALAATKGDDSDSSSTLTSKLTTENEIVLCGVTGSCHGGNGRDMDWSQEARLAPQLYLWLNYRKRRRRNAWKSTENRILLRKSILIHQRIYMKG